MSYLLDILFPNQSLDETLLQTSGVKTHPNFDGIVSIYRYHPPLSTYLHLIKYSYSYSLVDKLADIVSQNIKRNYKNILPYWQKNNFTILPIPLHWIRQNWRGFNQSQLLGFKIAKKLGLCYQQDILKRSIFTRPQVKLDDLSRQLHFTNKQIFSLQHIPKLGNYILFDDVTTTGSTLAASIKPLLPYCKNLPWGLTIAG